MKTKFNFYSILLYMLLIISCLFNGITIKIGQNLNINIGLIVYSFTFLFTALLFEKHKMKESKKSILTATILTFIFYIICSLICSLPMIDNEKIESLKNIISPNAIKIASFKLYYPNLNLISLLIIFLLTHYIFLIIYDLIKDNSNYLIGFILAIIISFILDQTFYTSISNIYNVVINDLNTIEIIKQLTANYFVVICSSVICLFIYPIFKRNY